MATSSDDAGPAAWRLGGRHGGADRVLHETLDCRNVGDPDHYRPADPDHEDAPWCRVCTGEHVCSECGETFDAAGALGALRVSHGGGGRDGLTVHDLASEDFGPEDLGLSPIGARPAGGRDD